MIEYKKIDVSEKIDMSKTSAWLFKNVGYKFVCVCINVRMY